MMCCTHINCEASAITVSRVFGGHNKAWQDSTEQDGLHPTQLPAKLITKPYYGTCWDIGGTQQVKYQMEITRTALRPQARQPNKSLLAYKSLKINKTTKAMGIKHQRNNPLLLTDAYNLSHQGMKINTDWEVSHIYNRTAYSSLTSVPVLSECTAYVIPRQVVPRNDTPIVPHKPHTFCSLSCKLVKDASFSFISASYLKHKKPC